MTINFRISREKTKQISLKWLLIIPFVIQIIGAVSLVGYLSYRSGQQAVEKLADKLMTQTSKNIQEHFNNFLGKAQDINLANVDAFKSGIIDLNNFEAMGKYFYKQANNYNFTTTSFSKYDGAYVGANRTAMGNDSGFEIYEIQKVGKQHNYAIDEDGNRTKINRIIVQESEEGIPKTLNWYTNAAKAKISPSKLKHLS